MIETKSIKRMVVSDEAVLITCNNCGAEFKPQNKNDYYWRESIKHFTINWGYGSAFDGQTWDFDLCENCLMRLIDGFAYKSDIELDLGV